VLGAWARLGLPDIPRRRRACGSGTFEKQRRNYQRMSLNREREREEERVWGKPLACVLLRGDGGREEPSQPAKCRCSGLYTSEGWGAMETTATLSDRWVHSFSSVFFLRSSFFFHGEGRTRRGGPWARLLLVWVFGIREWMAHLIPIPIPQTLTRKPLAAAAAPPPTCRDPSVRPLSVAARRARRRCPPHRLRPVPASPRASLLPPPRYSRAGSSLAQFKEVVARSAAC
jgi:hypothetical protein